jgi:hypothetical protein
LAWWPLHGETNLDSSWVLLPRRGAKSVILYCFGR